MGFGKAGSGLGEGTAASEFRSRMQKRSKTGHKKKSLKEPRMLGVGLASDGKSRTLCSGGSES